MNTHASLTISDYSINLHLGCTQQERQIPQQVRISLRMEFTKIPLACETDSLDDTICYARLCEKMTSRTEFRHFQTVEHLGKRILNLVKEDLPKRTKYHLRIHKVKPPIERLEGGVFFDLQGII